MIGPAFEPAPVILQRSMPSLFGIIKSVGRRPSHDRLQHGLLPWPHVSANNQMQPTVCLPIVLVALIHFGHHVSARRTEIQQVRVDYPLMSHKQYGGRILVDGRYLNVVSGQEYDDTTKCSLLNMRLLNLAGENGTSETPTP